MRSSNDATDLQWPSNTKRLHPSMSAEGNAMILQTGRSMAEHDTLSP